MTEPSNALPDHAIGGRTVIDNLRRAIDTGKVIEDADGSLRLAAPAGHDLNWVQHAAGEPLGCEFLMGLMFEHVYAKGAVPQGCSDCYKVKASLSTVRQLVAACDLAKALPFKSKWGVDLNNRFSQDVYAGYFYASGLEDARAIYGTIRPLLDAHPKLGPEVRLAIKRGCSEYEAALGPSDRYEFPPALAEVEAALRPKFRARAKPNTPRVQLAYWLEVAFRTGDDTYLEFTGGKRLAPRQVNYEPTP